MRGQPGSWLSLAQLARAGRGCASVDCAGGAWHIEQGDGILTKCPGRIAVARILPVGKNRGDVVRQRPGPDAGGRSGAGLRQIAVKHRDRDAQPLLHVGRFGLDRQPILGGCQHAERRPGDRQEQRHREQQLDEREAVGPLSLTVQAPTSLSAP